LLQAAEAARQQRLAELGIFFDENDHYDYEQHLREPGDLKKVELDAGTEFFTMKNKSKVSLILSFLLRITMTGQLAEMCRYPAGAPLSVRSGAEISLLSI